MRNLTPLRAYEHINDAYLRYFDTAFWLRDSKLMAERRALLRAEGAISREPIVETLPSHPEGPSIREVCSAAKLPKGVDDQLAAAIFRANSDFRLRPHQAEALLVSLRREGDARNPVVTSGTGSGKTECFLLPIFARLLTEASGWGPSAALHRWWQQDPSSDWQSLRKSEAPKRSKALRALVLYPTNALVEDQVARLRRAVAATSDSNGFPKFFFGRYTGATLGSGDVPSRVSDARETVHELKQIERQFEGLPKDSDLRANFPNPANGEMLTRWDMVCAPPDILITNFSMLNVMLMRELEEPLFLKTQEWLAGDSARAFTLVVDELHTYRGTQGSEVALTVRNLLRRIGIGPDSHQLRFDTQPRLCCIPDRNRPTFLSHRERTGAP